MHLKADQQGRAKNAGALGSGTKFAPVWRWWVTGALGVAPWDRGESELELRRLGRGRGCQDPWRQQKGDRTHRRASFSSSFLIVPSPHTVHYCFSYKLFKRWWKGMTWLHNGSTSPYFDVSVIRDSALVRCPGVQTSGSRAGGQQEAKS
ncbi:PREDICTED: putative cancer susceptibility gene HEPN1 protein [Galeopterus variegatus]|uniref:Cancer susceptibility gene HEPN1 protein n=1 Tax=Galeopterus variegatus TaxID=482537 RepID=A0ABM0R4M1_GALVR|nr:PREDICTED: putative cancer susceptibility gene HEPN1 protein [Galeopterus variegatus]